MSDLTVHSNISKITERYEKVLLFLVLEFTAVEYNWAIDMNILNALELSAKRLVVDNQHFSEKYTVFSEISLRD